MGVFCDPIIVCPGGWGDDLPEWLKAAITLERLIENVKSLTGESPTATGAEACAYLFTASLTAPMGADWNEIYLYIAGQVYEKHRTKDSGLTWPDDIRVKSLSNYQMGLLRRLKGDIYEKRVRVRQERNRARRRQQREEEIPEKNTEQLELLLL